MKQRFCSVLTKSDELIVKLHQFVIKLVNTFSATLVHNLKSDLQLIYEYCITQTLALRIGWRHTKYSA